MDCDALPLLGQDGILLFFVRKSFSVTFETWFQNKHPHIPHTSVSAVLKLAAEGATLPFIARYRKEATGNLNEVAIEQVLDGKEDWDGLTQRQTFIVSEIESQAKLTPELKAAILTCFDRDRLEDIYLPFKKKKKTKALLAKEAGLEPLADWIWNCGHGTDTPQPGQTLELWALTFRNEDKGILEVAAVLQGATDILVERLSEVQDLRERVREAFSQKGFLFCTKGEKAKPNSKFEKYFAYHESVASLKQPQNSHRYLALRRGWLESEIVARIGGPVEEPEFEKALLGAFESHACTVSDSPGAETLKRAALLAYQVYVRPAIESEVHRALKTVADEVAIGVFADNVRTLLLSAPLGPKSVLAVDPGIRTGCKVALVDASGKFTHHEVIALQTEEQKTKSKESLLALLAANPVDAIAIGNGTAGRETEIFFRAFLKEAGKPLPVVMVNESGASVYSASEAAREEFPDIDVTVRGAISIGRRLQDPLAELVKIDPKSIGVGQYQHDVPAHSLKKSLQRVVELSVNSVGVNVNTASTHLLAYVSGIGPALAKALVEKRNEKGLFRSRAELLEIPFFSTKTFEQAAGFLRVPNGTNPLDNTGVHPERYAVLEAFAQTIEKPVSSLLGAGASTVRSSKELQEQLGAFTFGDLVAELEKPGRDPRDSFTPFSFREDIFEVKDLQIGMACPGIVTNVTNFGAFVDIGVHQDGLVHLSQLANRFVRDPREVVNPGDRVQVRVLEVNLEKKQISLTMRAEKPAARPPRPPAQKTEKRPTAPRAPLAPRPSNSGGPPPRANTGSASARPNRNGASPQRPTRSTDSRPNTPPRNNTPRRPEPPRRREAPTRNEELKHNPFAALIALKNKS
jgi:protein Tex